MTLDFETELSEERDRAGHSFCCVDPGRGCMIQQRSTGFPIQQRQLSDCSGGEVALQTTALPTASRFHRHIPDYIRIVSSLVASVCTVFFGNDS